ncbi:MAG: hypothetical protein Q9160_008672 [Pyrenula sp. 1 TL-2023]
MADLGAATNYPVHVGVWTNWSLGGQVTGSIITLNHRNGAFLTAFLALFVTFTGSKLWRIACFTLHQQLMSEKQQDGLYHQRQVVLRNALDEKVGLLSFLRLIWAWRHKATRPFYRLLPIIIFSFVIAAAFILAGIFSSKISSSMGNEVLISSPNCGLFGLNTSASTNTTAYQQAEILDPWNAEKITSYANYAQRCYSETSTITNCLPFVKVRLPSTVDQNASCPFQETICRHRDGNIRLDTGYLNSQADLGLNAPLDHQFDLRIATHCAPLKSDNYKRTVYYSVDKPYTEYFYGSQLPNGNKTASHTFMAEQQNPNEWSWRNSSKPFADYALTTRSHPVYNGPEGLYGMSFLPIKELAEGPGDTLLIFLSANGVRYVEPIDDDWYAAHQVEKGSVDYADGRSHGLIDLYLADEPASALGCKLQYQSCDLTLPVDRRCSPWGGMSSVAFFDGAPNTKMGQLMNWVITFDSINTIIRTLRESSLTSRFRQEDVVSGPLPADQWKAEVENWHNVVLANLQGRRIDMAAGPGDTEMLEFFWSKPNNEEQRYICKNQKIVSTAYTNFSTMWLVIVLVLGTVIILVEFFLESIVVWLERRQIVKTPSAEWFSNDTLQLQRMAHEELGLGDWSGCNGPRVIPVTEKGQLLGILDRRDPNHPKLVNPDTVSGSASNAAQVAAKIDATSSATGVDVPSRSEHRSEDSGATINEQNTSHSLPDGSQNEGNEENVLRNNASQEEATQNDPIHSDSRLNDAQQKDSSENDRAQHVTYDSFSEDRSSKPSSIETYFSLAQAAVASAHPTGQSPTQPPDLNSASQPSICAEPSSPLDRLNVI